MWASGCQSFTGVIRSSWLRWSSTDDVEPSQAVQMALAARFLPESWWKWWLWFLPKLKSERATLIFDSSTYEAEAGQTFEFKDYIVSPCLKVTLSFTNQSNNKPGGSAWNPSIPEAREGGLHASRGQQPVYIENCRSAKGYLSQNIHTEARTTTPLKC